MELEMRADADGFNVSFRDMPELDVKAVALEDATGRVELERVHPVADGRRIEYRKGVVTEWYLNRTDGVEQGFTIHSAADRSASAPGTTTMLLSYGDKLTARIMPEGDKAVFSLKSTGTVYHYEDLRAWDGRGRDVPAHLEVSRLHDNSKTLAIVLDTTDAVYPIHVDPMIYGSEKKLTATDAAAGDRFGYSVSVAGDVALVGADGDDDVGGLSGSAYVFEQFFPVPEPVIVDIYAQDGNVVCEWTSAEPVDYTVQFRDGLEDDIAWSNLTGYVDMPGQDGTMAATNALNSHEKRFYGIRAANSPLR